MRALLLSEILDRSQIRWVLVGQKGVYLRQSYLLTMDDLSDVRW